MMADGGVEKVAIVYSLPEAAVLRGLFAQHDIATVVIGAGHAATNPEWVVALGGIIVCVQHEVADEARALLAEIAARPPAVRPRLIDDVALNAVAVILACVIGFAPIPPTRTTSTFLIGNVRRLDDQPQG